METRYQRIDEYDRTTFDKVVSIMEALGFHQFKYREQYPMYLPREKLNEKGLYYFEYCLDQKLGVMIPARRWFGTFRRNVLEVYVQEDKYAIAANLEIRCHGIGIEGFSRDIKELHDLMVSAGVRLKSNQDF